MSQSFRARASRSEPNSSFSPRSRQERLATVEALLRPVRESIVIFGDGGGTRWQYDPRLLGRRVDVDVGWQVIGLVERAHEHERHEVACAGVVAPYRDAARRTANDLLSFSTVRRRHDDVGLTLENLDSVGLDERVECERSPGLALAPSAMAAVDPKGPRRHAVANRATGAAAV